MNFSDPAWLLFALPIGLLWWLCRNRRPALNRWRLILLVTLLLALAGWSIRWPRPGGFVVVVADRSASLPEDAEQLQREIISRLEHEMNPEHHLAVISVGEQAAIEHNHQQGTFNGFEVQVGADQSRLAEGLDLAQSLIPSGTPGRILVLGDGHWTGHDPIASTQRAAMQNIPVDYRLLSRESLRDLSIHSVSAPSAITKGQSFLIHAWINAPEDQTIAYTLERNGQKIARGEKTISSGINRIIFRDQLERAGAAAYQLTIEGSQTDPLPQNNRARFMVGVEGDLPVLCLSRTPGGAFGKLLAGAGMRVETYSPDQFTWSLENLANYSGVVLENISAQELGSRGMELLAAWVETTGRGLLTTGGKRAYGAGGYFHSALERILPISMELRREHRKLLLAIAVVLDRSGSMGAPVTGGQTKMDLANIGSVQVLDLLSDMDEFGVIAVDSLPHTILNLKSVEECRKRRRDILQIESMGGGIFVYEGLVSASKMLAGAQAGTRHIILFADAADAEEPGKYKELLEHNRMANISVSVVALGTPSDTDAGLLKDIAARGDGQIYFTENALEVPRIFAQDTFAVARSAFQENPTGLQWTPLMALLAGGRTYPEPPPLGGYNLNYIREGAQVLAVSTDEYAAPLAAGWQAGAGRVLCYAGEVDGEFTGPLGQWSEYGSFLASMVRWVVGKQTPLPEGMLLTQEINEGICRIALHLDPDRTNVMISEKPQVNVLRGNPGQSPQTETFEMQWVSADLLELQIPLSGAETIIPSVVIDQLLPIAMPPACLKHSPEYEPKANGAGLSALERLATVGGGKERLDVDAIWNDLPRSWNWISLRPILLLMATLLFILEIVERRVGLAQLKRFKRTETSPPASSMKNKKTHSPSQKTPASPAVEQEHQEPESPLKAARRRAQSRFRR